MKRKKGDPAKKSIELLKIFWQYIKSISFKTKYICNISFIQNTTYVVLNDSVWLRSFYLLIEYKIMYIYRWAFQPIFHFSFWLTKLPKTKIGCVIFCIMFSIFKARQARQKWKIINKQTNYYVIFLFS